MLEYDLASRLRRNTVACILVLVAAYGQGSRGAELRLRRECRPKLPVVRLGDVAEVAAADASRVAELERLELFAAPPAGQKRYLRLRELQDMLLARGEGLLELQFSGASQVVVLGAGLSTPSQPARPVSVLARQKAEQFAAKAIGEYLATRVAGAGAWKIDVVLEDSAARAVIEAGGPCRVSGGKPPWQGRQRFELAPVGGDATRAIAVEAEVSVPPAVVVAARSLARGTRLAAGDLAVRRDVEPGGNTGVFRTVEDLVGQEVRRTIPAGTVIAADWVGPPVVIRRGDAVTVFVRAPGLRLTTQARARADGMLGELVVLESPVDRKRFVARVRGAGEAEVMAGAVAAGSDRAGTTPGFSRSAGNRVGRVARRAR